MKLKYLLLVVSYTRSNLFLYFASTQSSLICASLQTKRKHSFLHTGSFCLPNCFLMLHPFLLLFVFLIVTYHVPPQNITSAPKYLKQTQWYFSHEKHLWFLMSKKNLKGLGPFWEIWKVWSIIFFSLPEQCPNSLERWHVKCTSCSEAFRFKIYFFNSFIMQVFHALCDES